MEGLFYKKICHFSQNESNYFSQNSQSVEELFYDSPRKICCVLSKLVYTQGTLIKETGLVYTTSFSNGNLYISFKGTSNLSDVISDIKFIRVDDKYNIPGKMHKGFHDLVLTKGTPEKLLEIIRGFKDVDKIYITGHSLGGACATIFYTYLENFLPNKEKFLVTFGSPRVGDLEFSESVDSENSIRYVNGDDLVTSIPKIFLYLVKNFQDKYKKL